MMFNKRLSIAGALLVVLPTISFASSVPKRIKHTITNTDILQKSLGRLADNKYYMVINRNIGVLYMKPHILADLPKVFAFPLALIGYTHGHKSTLLTSYNCNKLPYDKFDHLMTMGGTSPYITKIIFSSQTVSSTLHRKLNYAIMCTPHNKQLSLNQYNSFIDWPIVHIKNKSVRLNFDLNYNSLKYNNDSRYTSFGLMANKDGNMFIFG